MAPPPDRRGSRADLDADRSSTRATVHVQDTGVFAVPLRSGSRLGTGSDLGSGSGSGSGSGLGSG